MTSKCGKNKKVAHEAQPSVSLMFLPHFDGKMPFYFKFRYFDRDENRKMFCMEDGCGLSNIMKHSLEKWPECDEIFRDFFGFGARKPSDEAARGMGRKWGGKKK